MTAPTKTALGMGAALVAAAFVVADTTGHDGSPQVAPVASAPQPIETIVTLDGKTVPVGSTLSSAASGGTATPLGEQYDVLITLLSSAGGGCFLLADPSLPGAPDDVVTFDGVAEDIRTDVVGTVPTVIETLVDNGDGSFDLEICASSPMGTELFPVSAGLTGGGNVLDTPCWFVGGGDALDWDGLDFVTSAQVEFFLDGTPVVITGSAPPTSIFSLSPAIFFDFPNPWDGGVGISFGGVANLPNNSVKLRLIVSKVPIKPPFCPADCANGDGFVDVADLLTLLAEWGLADPNCDFAPIGAPNGAVDVGDLLALLAAWGPCPSPANDDCVNATVAVNGANAYDTNGASTDGPNSPSCAFAAGDSQIHCDVWFTYTATCDGILTINNCGSFTHDSRIAVYDGTAGCPVADTQIACNDDADCGTGGLGSLQSEVVLAPVTNGTQYLIRLGGFGDPGNGFLPSKSNGVLNISCVLPPNPASCDDRTPLGGAFPVAASGDTNTGTNESAPPCTSPGGLLGQIGPGKWYSIIGNGNDLRASCDLLGLWGGAMTVYCNDCTNLLCVGANGLTANGFSEPFDVDWRSEVGVEYLILVHTDGQVPTTGPYTLTVSDLGTQNGVPPQCALPTPINDDCPNALPIGDVSGQPFSTRDPQATTDGPLGDGGFGCPFGSVPGRDIWYCYTASCDGTLVVDTCATRDVDPLFDTVVYVYDTCGCPNLASVPLGCDDDGCGDGGGSSYATAAIVTAGNQYLIRVGGWFGGGGESTASTGDGVFSVSCTPVVFESSQTFGALGTPVELETCDLDNDNDIDLIVVLPDPNPLQNGTIQVFINEGNDGMNNWLGFTAQQPIQVGLDPTDAACDALDDTDSLRDVAVTNAGDDTVTVKLTAGGGGGGNFPTTVTFGVGDHPNAIDAGSFNPEEDDCIDLVVVNAGADDSLEVYQNCGSMCATCPGPLAFGGTTFELRDVIGVQNDPRGIDTGDLDNDKDLDFVVANFGSNSLSVVPQVSGTLQTPINIGAGVQPVDVAIGDFSDAPDGFRDFVSSDSVINGTATLVKNSGSHLYTVNDTLTVGATPLAIDAAPLDANNGSPDLALAATDPSRGPAIQVFIANGNFTFGKPTAYKTGGAPVDVTAADVDGDGRIDLIVANRTPDSIVVLLNKSQ